MRLNSQPSHIVSFLPGITTKRGGVAATACWWEDKNAARPHVPVQQVRRPVGLAPRPRDEADGVVLAPAAPLLAEASFGDAGHAGSPRSSRRCWWFAPRWAGWVLARERCGRCNCACCCLAGHTPRRFRSQNERAQYGRSDGTSSSPAPPRRVGVGGFFGRTSRRPRPARYVLGSRRCFRRSAGVPRELTSPQISIQ